MLMPPRYLVVDVPRSISEASAGEYQGEHF
jgi:hypothetical protein